jgi:hypothetical protein
MQGSGGVLVQVRVDEMRVRHSTAHSSMSLCIVEAFLAER